MLDRLEEAGHIRREPSLEDRRVTHITLTEKNRRLRDRYDQVSREMTELFYEGFAPDEIATFERGLRRILGNLKKCE
jgi:DNA-binding MarR family transcriptional regulator